MPPQPPGQERTSSIDDPLIIGLIVLVAYGGVWAAWHFAHAQIATLYSYARWVEFYGFYLLGQFVSVSGIQFLHDWIEGLCAPQALTGPCTRDFSQVSWPQISDSSVYINLVLLVGLLGYCVRQILGAQQTHPKLKFVRSHTVRSFVDELKDATNPKDGELLYPHLRVFSALNLIDAALDDPLFGMSETSKQFVFKHRLVLDWRAEGSNFWAPTLDRAKAAIVLRAQLGQHWTSSMNLSAGETLMAAVTMSRVAATDPTQDEKAFKAAMASSDAMIRYCWQQFHPPSTKPRSKTKSVGDANAWLWPQIDLTLPREVIQRYIAHPAVQHILERHAFNRTVLFALFMQARRLGVLHPAELRWLRFYDRGLWYAIQTIGREAGFAEAAGLLSHYLYEARAGISIAEPQLDKAISGLDSALNKFKFSAADKTRYEASTPLPDTPRVA